MEAIAVAIVIPADGPSFGTAPGRDVDVDVVLPEPVRVDVRAPSPCVRTHECAAWADSCITSPSWPVTFRPPVAGIRRRLDEEDVSADRGHGEPCRDARAQRCACARPRRTGAARATRGRAFSSALIFSRLALGDPACRLAADRGDLALELPNAGLARVLADDRLQALVGERELRALEAVRLQLLRDEVLLGDPELLFLGVAREAGSRPSGRGAAAGSSRAGSRCR